MHLMHCVDGQAHHAAWQISSGLATLLLGMTIVIGTRLHLIIVVYSCTMHSCMVQSVCKEHATLQKHLVAAVQLNIQLIYYASRSALLP